MKIFPLALLALTIGACAAGAPPASTSAVDPVAQFLLDAGSVDQFEIQSGQIALQTMNPAVRSFAQMLIADHKALDDQLATAAPPGLVPPPSLLPLEQHKQILAELNAAPPGAFDDPQYFAGIQLKAQQEAIAAFRHYAWFGSDPNLRAFAAGALPMLRKHMEAARALLPH